MFLMCVRMVCTDKYSSEAISTLVRPALSSSANWREKIVSSFRPTLNSRSMKTNGLKAARFSTILVTKKPSWRRASMTAFGLSASTCEEMILPELSFAGQQDTYLNILGEEALRRSLENGVVEVAPLAYMRGRTLRHAFAILGTCCGLAAVGICKGLFLIEAGYRRLPVPAFWHPVIGALGFALVGMADRLDTY